GVTRDVSMKGVFFETDQPFSVGDTVEFTIAMHYAVPNPSVCLRCQGEVVRVEPASTGVGVAAALVSHSFENGQMSA
ncbi:MAG: PilZ domain-containing protein, partial [Nitrospirae bacterium]|nr:PilZ domain-containing protein [Nitrospirota bacterium]